ncbi:MAG: hypothetical protein COY40_03690 [Alphaproteobacteria bacterium CG_4_10_14_0_8_um_filter_53_9]|nr:MAG: hypothetical protein COY40_03690 [Alphaproteobacteria bacterium CG_4_10_14_0_8_um_filter_53_9]
MADNVLAGDWQTCVRIILKPEETERNFKHPEALASLLASQGRLDRVKYPLREEVLDIFSRGKIIQQQRVLLVPLLVELNVDPLPFDKIEEVFRGVVMILEDSLQRVLFPYEGLAERAGVVVFVYASPDDFKQLDDREGLEAALLRVGGYLRKKIPDVT